MQFRTKFTALAVSGTAGFALTVLGMRALTQRGHNRGAVQAVNVAHNNEQTDPSSDARPAAKGGAWGKSGSLRREGPALAAQFRTALTLMGIDPVWAEDLAADNASSFPELMERMKTLPGLKQNELRKLLLGRWAELDPEGGAEFFKSRDEKHYLTELLRQWQRLDFPAAVTKAEAYGRDFLRTTLCDKAVLDAPGLLAWLGDRPDLNPLALLNSNFTGTAADALESLLKIDPDKILAWSRQLPEDEWGAFFSEILAAQLARRSPDEAIDWAKSLKTGRRAVSLAAVAEAFAASQPERALTLMAELSPEEGAASLCDKVIAGLDFRDTDKILAMANALPEGTLRTRLLKATVSGLLETDPARAFALSETGASGFIPIDSIEVPAGALTPDGARRLLDAAGAAAPGASSLKETAVKETLLAWMEKDPASLAGYLRGKMDSPLLASMKENLQSGLAIQNTLTGAADPALVEIIGLPPEALVKKQIDRDPNKAVTTFEKVEDPASRIQLAGDIANMMNRTDAMAWAGTLKNSGEQAAVWKTIAKDWVSRDSLRASEWINSLPEGQGRDSAIQSMTEQVGKTDPDLAWKWALSITDSSMKQQALAAAAQEWAGKDAGALRQAVESGNFTAAEREKLLGKLPSGTPSK